MILRLIFSTGQIYDKNLSVRQNVVGGVVRLGKIKCAAKALACVSACSSFNFAKRWHFVCHFPVRFLCQSYRLLG